MSIKGTKDENDSDPYLNFMQYQIPREGTNHPDQYNRLKLSIHNYLNLHRPKRLHWRIDEFQVFLISPIGSMFI